MHVHLHVTLSSARPQTRLPRLQREMANVIIDSKFTNQQPPQPPPQQQPTVLPVCPFLQQRQPKSDSSSASSFCSANSSPPPFEPLTGDDLLSNEFGDLLAELTSEFD